MKRIIVYSLLINSLISCKRQKDESVPCEILSFTKTASLETEYGCVDTKHLMQINLADAYKVITSQAEFNALVSGPCKPVIDFNKYSLIIGKKNLQNGNREIQCSLTRFCGVKTDLHVKIINDFSSPGPNITYHALVPRLNANEHLVVDIQVVQ